MPCCGGRIVQRAKLLLLLAVFMGTSEGSCSKTVIFIRHGQAEHNILLERGQRDQARKILDPPLSALGVQQAEALRENSLLLDALSGPHDPLVVVSPLRRTLQTAIGGLGAWARDKEGRRLICNADLQETGEVACDSGSPDISTNFAGELDVLDFSQLEDGWERKDGINKDLPVPLKTRLTRFQEWLAKRPERRVVVVAHHNVFLALLRVSFFNCEVCPFLCAPTDFVHPFCDLQLNHFAFCLCAGAQV